MPKLEYPAYFDGLKGLQVKEEIQYREGFLYVPTKMIITIAKAKNHPVVGKIIKEN